MEDEEGRDSEPRFSFERNKHLLPAYYRASDGRTVEIRLMDDSHLYCAWRWWFDHRADSDKAEFIYEALQREKERRARIRDEERAAFAAAGFPAKRRQRRPK